MNSNEMFKLAEKLKALKDEKADLETRLKEVNATIDSVDFELATMMMDSETQNFTVAGTMFCLTNKVRASAVADRKEELYETLRNEGYGDLVYETVNANSLSAFVKEQMEEHDDVPEWLNGLVNVFEKTTVGVRKATRK